MDVQMSWQVSISDVVFHNRQKSRKQKPQRFKNEVNDIGTIERRKIKICIELCIDRYEDGSHNSFRVVGLNSANNVLDFFSQHFDFQLHKVPILVLTGNLRGKNTAFHFEI